MEKVDLPKNCPVCGSKMEQLQKHPNIQIGVGCSQDNWHLSIFDHIDGKKAKTGHLFFFSDFFSDVVDFNRLKGEETTLEEFIRRIKLMAFQ